MSEEANSTHINEEEQQDVPETSSPPAKKIRLAERVDSEEKDKDDEGKNSRKNPDEERVRMQVLVSHFSEDQLNRYEMYRRAAFSKAAIRRILQSLTGTTVPQNVVIAMAGIAKVFVGEVVETALDVMEERKNKPPLQPKHLRESVRRLKHKDLLQNSTQWKRMFR